MTVGDITSRLRQLGLTLLPFLLLVSSYLLVAVSVHTYCENRKFAAVLGAMTAALLVYFVRDLWLHRVHAAVRILGLLFCSLGLFIDVAFIIWATNTCRHMFDNLSK